MQMKAEVTKAKMGVIDGTVEPKQFHVGDVVEGALAKEAIAGKWGKEIEARQPPAKQPAKDNASGEKSGAGGAGAVQTPGNASDAKPVDIPAAWKTLKAPDLIALAKAVSGADVADVAAAQKIIVDEAAKRAAAATKA
jgi:hypothetical protein